MKNSVDVAAHLFLHISYIGTKAGTKVRAHLHVICINISMADASQETYACRNILACSQGCLLSRTTNEC